MKRTGFYGYGSVVATLSCKSEQKMEASLSRFLIIRNCESARCVRLFDSQDCLKSCSRCKREREGISDKKPCKYAKCGSGRFGLRKVSGTSGSHSWNMETRAIDNNKKWIFLLSWSNEIEHGRAQHLVSVIDNALVTPLLAHA